jgi:hypothetical protein
MGMNSSRGFDVEHSKQFIGRNKMAYIGYQKDISFNANARCLSV